MTDSLVGRTIVVTRPGAAGARLVARIAAAGGRGHHVATIQVLPPSDLAPLARELARAGEYDWLVLTSPNAVAAVVAVLGALPPARRIAAVGPGTAAALAAAGGRADAIPEAAHAAALPGVLGALRGTRVLLPRSGAADDEFPRALRAAGADVTVLTAYHAVTRQPPAAELAALAAGFDLAVFASPSAVRGWVDAVVPGLPAALALPPCVCIGPATAAAARKAGFGEIEEADGRADEELMAAMARAAQRSPAQRRAP